MVEQRAGASGPFSLPATVRRAAWDALANLQLSVLPSGHPKGNYELQVNVAVLANPGGAGLAQLVAQWRDGGSMQTFLPITQYDLTTVGQPAGTTPISLHSDGGAAILVELQPGGVGPGAVFDVSCSALQVSRG
jgi:hypothetical protein